MQFNVNWIKSNPKTTTAIVLVGALVLYFLAFRKSGDTSITYSPGGAAQVSDAVQLGTLQYNAKMAEITAATGSQGAQYDYQLSAATLGYTAQQNLATISAGVDMSSISAQLQTALAQVSASTTQAKLSADTSIALTALQTNAMIQQQAIQVGGNVAIAGIQGDVTKTLAQYSAMVGINQSDNVRIASVEMSRANAAASSAIASSKSGSDMFGSLMGALPSFAGMFV